MVGTAIATGWSWSRIPYSQDSFENPSILVSNDGASWAPPPGINNPIALPNTSYLADADLVYDQASDQLWMYYPHQTVNGQTRMIRKTSSDGINWGDPYNEPLLFSVPDYQLLSPAVVKVGSTYKMWSVNTGSPGCDGQSNFVQLRTSTNGTSWSAPSNVSFAIPNMLPWHIDVIYVPSKAEYWALVPAYAPGSDCTNTELYFAKSSDGVNWTTYATPALRKGSGWDSGQIYRSTLIYDAGHRHAAGLVLGQQWIRLAPRLCRTQVHRLPAGIERDQHARAVGQRDVEPVHPASRARQRIRPICPEYRVGLQCGDPAQQLRRVCPGVGDV